MFQLICKINVLLLKHLSLLFFTTIVFVGIYISNGALSQDRPSKDFPTYSIITAFNSCLKKANRVYSKQRAFDYCVCTADEMRYTISNEELIQFSAEFMEQRSQGALDHEIEPTNKKFEAMAAKCLKKIMNKN